MDLPASCNAQVAEFYFAYKAIQCMIDKQTKAFHRLRQEAISAGFTEGATKNAGTLKVASCPFLLALCALTNLIPILSLGCYNA